MSLSTEQPMTFLLVDYTRELADKIIEAFPDTLKNGQPRFLFNKVDPEVFDQREKIFRQNVEKGLVDAILVIPDTIMNGGSLTYYAKTVSNIDLIQKLQNGISELLTTIRLKNVGLDPEMVKKLTRRINIRTIKIEKGTTKERGFSQEYITSMTFLIILYMTILVYGSQMMRSVIEEKTSRIIEVLLSSMNSFQLMMGKLIGVGIAGLVQYLIWAVMALITFLIAINSAPNIVEFVSISPVTFFYFVLFFVMGFFTFSTLYTAVGAMCSDMQDAQSLSTPITFLVIIPFMASFMVMKDPTTDIARLLSFLPFFTPMIMFLRISLVMPPAWEILTSLVINLLTIIVIVWLTARIYRVGILMYGKRPNVPEIIKWIRYS